MHPGIYKAGCTTIGSCKLKMRLCGCIVLSTLPTLAQCSSSGPGYIYQVNSSICNWSQFRGGFQSPEHGLLGLIGLKLARCADQSISMEDQNGGNGTIPTVPIPHLSIDILQRILRWNIEWPAKLWRVEMRVTPCLPLLTILQVAQRRLLSNCLSALDGICNRPTYRACYLHFLIHPTHQLILRMG